jgi:hypothetical protein
MSMMPAVMSMMPHAFVAPLVPVLATSSVSGTHLQTSGSRTDQQGAAKQKRKQVFHT